MKKRKNTKNKLDKHISILAFVLVLFGFYMLTTSTIDFYISFHNFDLSYNIAVITNDVARHTDGKIIMDYRNLRDQYGSNENDTIRYVDSYRESFHSMKNSFPNAIVGGMLFGTGLMILLVEADKKKK